MKPRIVICATKVPFAYGGAEMLVDSLRDALAARDFAVDGLPRSKGNEEHAQTRGT